MKSRGDRQYPRVLVVNGEPFTKRSATGLTLESLFRGWPKENLACLFFAECEPSLEVCTRYWRLSSADVLFARVMHALLRKPLRVPSEVTSASAVVETSRPCPEPSASRSHWSDNSKPYGWLRSIANSQSLMQLASYRIPTDMLTQIEAFEPQVLYTMLGANTVLRLVRDVHARCGVPIVPHIMDDWPSTLYRNSIFRPILRPRMKAGWRMVLAHAPLKLTIGQDMADEYSRRYGGTFTPFMNAVEPEFLVRSPTLVEARRTVRVAYVGGLHLGRWQSLLDIGAALEALQGEGHDAELLIYTQPRFESEAKRLSLPGVIRVVGSLAPSDVPAVLRSADILVHVESFNSRARKYARYSISTKIPECMGASRPVLAYGPAELASIRYVSNSGAGVSVGRRDRKELIQALRTLLDSAALREELGGRGLEVASRYHHAEGQREQLRSMLAAIATEEVVVDARTGL